LISFEEFSLGYKDELTWLTARDHPPSGFASIKRYLNDPQMMDEIWPFVGHNASMETGLSESRILLSKSISSCKEEIADT
jgi:hypothetical protein